MDLGTVLSAAQTLFSALNCAELKEVLSSIDYKSKLDDLQRTVTTIKAVLRDAETKQELSEQDQNWIKELKDAVFEADDLFDEFVTLAEQKQLLEADGSVSKKLSNFFSGSKNPFSLGYRMSRGVKEMRNKLKAIADNSQFSFKIDPEPTRKRSRETCSFVNKVDIVGREPDLEHIVGTLLASSDQGDVSFLSIVGIGGLGKTALAQLVYNDPRVTNAFQLKMWTCVSDEDQKELDVKNILGKILGRNQVGSTMEQVQSQLRDQLAGKKYLLVLDDVWTEKRDQWCELVRYLIGEKRGSWIVVTARSHETATITGGLMHELSGLSKEISWRLFETTAFASHQPNPPDELVMIGQKIVDGCSGVPLAIRVAGTLLFGQDKSKWEHVQKIGLANIREDKNGIMHILKLSFHHLESPLKNCFRYCALFPKDYEMEKAMLIKLWMAQGYIVPFDKFQSFEDAADEYFSILSKRCFFQDIKYNKSGEIKSCKIHDLMHDIAQNVSGNEMYALDNTEGKVDENVRHLSILNKSGYDQFYSLGKTHIRSLLFYHCGYNFQLAVESLVEKFRCLRVLDLSGKNIKLLPDSIGELLHLRYIDLSWNEDMEVLPNSITKICNLQTLLLRSCMELKELPKDFSRLVKLRFLDIRKCEKLASMPRGMGKLTCLNTLKGVYRVGGRGRCTSWKQWFDRLNDLKYLINLRGELVIHMFRPKNAKNDVKEDGKEGLYLKSLEHLDHLYLKFFGEYSGRMSEDEEGIIMRVMKYLQPHSNLKSLMVLGYRGVKMPGWVTATLLPQLVRLELASCTDLKYLQCLGNLRHLKSLRLKKLPKLEYIEEEEEDRRMLASTSTSAQKVSFFPSLEKLELFDLPKFQGWKKGVGMEESNNNSSSNKQCLSQLKELCIFYCPDFTCILLCPVLETLELIKFNERLQVCCSKTDEILSEAAAIENPDNSDTSIVVPKLRNVTVSNVAWLNLMPMESFPSLQILDIDDAEMKDLPSWIQHLSALRTLRIYRCSYLRAMPNWLSKLTSLRLLVFRGCSKSLEGRCQTPPGEDWPNIQNIPTVIFTLLC